MIFKNRKGSALSSSLFVLVLVIGGFVLFKVIKAGVDAKSTKSEITEKIGLERGSELTRARIVEIISDVAQSKGFELVEADGEIDGRKGKINIKFRYIQTIDFLITKSKKERSESYQIEAYGY